MNKISQTGGVFLNLQQLEYFIALAQNEHMTQTAKQLNTSQPNLSYAMNELEKELGAPLIKKVGRNIKLTQYGKVFHKYAKQALKELNVGVELIQNAVNPTVGTINFGFIYTMGSKIAPKSVQHFLEDPQNSNLRFSFRQGNTHKIIQLLMEEAIDIGLCSMISDNPMIDFDIFQEEKLVIVVPTDHPLSHLDSLYLEQTITFPYVYFDKNSGLRPYLDDVFESLKLSPKHKFFVEEDHTMLGFISAGFGIGILPDIPSISAYPVKKINILDPLSARHIYVATRKDTFLPPAVKRFKHFLLSN